VLLTHPSFHTFQKSESCKEDDENDENVGGGKLCDHFQRPFVCWSIMTAMAMPKKEQV
jgi:hypothetical protein